MKPSSHIPCLASNNSKEKRIEIERDIVPRGSSVVFVDGILSTVKTLGAVLQQLDKASIGAEDIIIMVVAKSSVHHGWELLH